MQRNKLKKTAVGLVMAAVMATPATAMGADANAAESNAAVQSETTNDGFGSEAVKLAAPQIDDVELVKLRNGNAQYHLSFEDEAGSKAIRAYLNAAKDSTVTLNGEAAKQSFKAVFGKKDENSYKVNRGKDKGFDFTKDCFADDETVVVVIAVPGYEDLVFTMEDQELEDGDEAILAAPAVDALIAKDHYGHKYFRLYFKEGADLEDYIDEVESVTLNGKDAKEVERVVDFLRRDKNSYKTANDENIDFTKDCFPEGEVVVVVKADGYEDLTFTVVNGDLAESKPDVPAEDQLVEQAKIEDMGFARYLVADLAEGCNAENTTFAVDGVTVHPTKVSDDGNIVKWEVETLNHAALTVASGDQSQTVKLSDNAPAAFTETKGTEDYSFLLNGPVYVWDYHLTNYDEAGNVRVSPAKTTFSVGAQKEGIPFYSPDAVLYQDENSLPYGVKGEVEMMFNYSTDAEKAFVDGITDVDLVAHANRNETLNDDLDYTLDKAYAHNGSTVACIKVPLGQVNFMSNGRYNLRVTSNGTAKLFPIHVVNEVVPSISSVLTENVGAQGTEVGFRIQDMTYGITRPVYRVDLTDAQGNTETLAKYDDWFLHGDLLVVYNEKTNHFPVDGNYTITVYADGFQAFSKTFHMNAVKSNAAPAAAMAMTRSYDAISTASVGGGGSEGGGDTKVMNAFLTVDADLLINAKLITALGIDNEAAKGISDRYDNMSKVSVYPEGAEVVYDAEAYLDAVNGARVNGEYLSYADYAASGNAVETKNRPYNVKEVLEDNLLGETNSFAEASGKVAPALTFIKQEGNDVVFSCEDAAYLEAVKAGKLYLNTPYASLAAEDFTVDAAAKTLTLHKAEVGENVLTVRAEGYKTAEVSFTFEKELQEVVLEAAGGKLGDAVTVTCTADHDVCDFFANLTAVKLIAPNGAERVVRPDGAESVFDEIGYTVENNVLTIGKDIFKEAWAQDENGAFLAGEYKVVLTAEYYGDKEAAFTMEANADEVIAAPSVKDVVYKTQFMGGSYYNVSFNADETAAGAFVEAINNITVNGTKVKPVASFYNDTMSYKTSNDPAFGGVYQFVDFTEDCFKGEATVVISADGYKDLTFVVKDGELIDNGGEAAPEIKAAPAVGETTLEGSDITGKYYRTAFAAEEGVGAYLAAAKAEGKITVNGVELKAASTTLFNETLAYKFSNDPAYGGEDKFIDFTADCFAELPAEVVTVPGYETLTYTVEAPAPEVQAAPTVKDITYKTQFMGGNYYIVSFNADETAAGAFAEAINNITVNGAKVKPVASFFNDAMSYKTSNDPVFGGAYQFVDFTEDCFKGDAKVVITADGYEDLTFNVKDGKLVDGAAPELLAAPAVKDVVFNSNFFGGNSYTALLDGDEETVAAFVNAIANIEANGVKVKRVATFYNDTMSYKPATDEAQGFTTGVEFTEDCFKGDVTVVIEAEGYNALTFDVTDGVVK